MILGNIEKHNGSGLVAFLDILGFSNEIMDNWNNQDDNPLDKLLRLKEGLPINTGSELVSFYKEDQNINVRKYSCRVQSISDSIVVSFGFNENLIYGDVILGIKIFFNTISAIWRNTLKAGFTIRGAADWGDIFWNDKEIIGPAFINTYRLEQNIAKSSRVIISSNLNQNLAKMFNQEKTFWNDELLKNLTKDTDGYLILNPHTLYYDEVEKDKTHLIHIIQKLRDNADGLNKEKYSSILANLNSENKKLKSEELGRY